PGGVFYFLRNGPAVIEMAKTMEQVCPDALMLNYTNPMVMISWAVTRTTKIRYVGLCHSVQGTARTLADYIGAPFAEISYWAAGINHMAWFLEYRWKGQDAYPLIWEAMKKPEIYERDIVKFEVLKYFGAFVSESSIHMSEYVPYFRRTPELIERHTSPKMWGVPAEDPTRRDPQKRWAAFEERRRQQDEELRRLAMSDEPVPLERSHEFCSFILNAHETNQPYLFNGNVPNTSLITNLLPNAVVEVPIVVDRCGLHPCHVGDLPPALAALNRSNLAVQELAVKGLIERDRESIYRAVQLDPLTASLLSLEQIREMVTRMFAADAEWITI
ncbi:MAG: alpha-glucosidase/alpha-galactosidase, partial [Chloroflexi bacterium]|nr:alpha-glucosidase/alpha-galactosidase [Chloroflexota bacterium]